MPLTLQHFADPAGQIGPVGLRQVKVGSQIQQRALLDNLAHANRLYQAVGEIGLSGLAVARVGAANEHARRMPRHIGEGKRSLSFYGTTILIGRHSPGFPPVFHAKWGKFGKIPKTLAKMG
jgi:hypothetical protein